MTRCRRGSRNVEPADADTPASGRDQRCDGTDESGLRDQTTPRDRFATGGRTK